MAARAKTLLLLLAALCLPAFAHVPRASHVAQKPHQGVERFAPASHRGPGAANALTAPGFCECLYDKGGRSRSTAKERDDESGLDYFGARYFGSSLGRFTSADAPFLDQTPVDPQSWNLYAYVRNNPLRYIDPNGQAIELPEDEEERARVLAALQESVGAEAGQYLYDNEYEGKHYVGVYTGGPDGTGPDFASINDASGFVSGVIARPEVASVGIVAEGSQVTQLGMTTTIGSIDAGRSPGFTGPGGPDFIKPGGLAQGMNRAGILLTNGDTGSLPGIVMENGQPGTQTLGTVLIHELGHATAVFDAMPKGISDLRAVDAENRSRSLRGAPRRILHDPPGR